MIFHFVFSAINSKIVFENVLVFLLNDYKDMLLTVLQGGAEWVFNLLTKIIPPLFIFLSESQLYFIYKVKFKPF